MATTGCIPGNFLFELKIMVKDKYTAVWVSHSSSGDFLKCPRAYYLNNVYKDPVSGHKIKLISPPLALGQVAHEVIESLSVIPVKNRFTDPLMIKFESAWKKISGERGGFKDKDQEYLYKKRGMEMIERVVKNPGPLLNLAVKITMDLPYFWLSEEDNIILCGKIDWLEYLPKSDSVHIIDFKTGKADEKPGSLQLPIYHLLVHHCQKRKVTRASYWYLDKSSGLTEVALPDLQKAKEEVLSIAKEMKLATVLGRFICREKTGCYACRPFEAILRKEAKRVGYDEYNNDVYIIDQKNSSEEEGSKIL